MQNSANPHAVVRLIALRTGLYEPSMHIRDAPCTCSGVLAMRMAMYAHP